MSMGMRVVAFFLVACYLLVHIWLIYSARQNVLPVRSFDDNITHIAAIFDSARFEYVSAMVRSILFYTHRRVEFHLVSELGLEDRMRAELRGYVNATVHFYDIKKCRDAVALFRGFGSASLHVSAHCKYQLASILPHYVEKILFIDNDITATQDVFACWNVDFTDGAYVGMVADAGDVCQFYPDECWPIAFGWVVPNGLHCGMTANRVKKAKMKNTARCPRAGDTETYQLNGGVLLLNLTHMRRISFAEHFLNVTVQTARNVNFKQVRWAQDLMNNFFRYFPQALQEMPCGCNYQFTGARRFVKCPEKPVVLTHGWNSGVLKENDTPYNKLFFFFKSKRESLELPPNVSLISEVQPDSPKEPPQRLPTPDCRLQSYFCDTIVKENYIRDQVTVITIAKHGGNVFETHRALIASQSHPRLVHFVLTAKHVTLKNLHLPDSRFLTLELQAQGAYESKCGGASFVRSRRKCLEYLLRTYSHVVPKSEWVILMDDSELFTDEAVVTHLLANVTTKQDMLSWYFPTKSSSAQIEGIFMHTASLRNPAARPSTWNGRTLTVVHPLTDHWDTKVTVLITAYNMESLRVRWLRQVLYSYLHPRFSSLIDRVILVWNNPEVPPPDNLPSGTVILRQQVNSLNNRWTNVFPYVRTDAILNLDDDIFVHQIALICLIGYWLQDTDRIVGPFARRATESGDYYMNELRDRSPEVYSMILPRSYLFHRKHLENYRQNVPRFVKQYVDSQDAHCDDLVFNMAARHATNKPPLRVVFPNNSLTDYFDVCHRKFRQESGGISLQKNRTVLRTECFRWLKSNYLQATLTETSEVGVCGVHGSMIGVSDAINVAQWRTMLRTQVDCFGIGEVLL